jgi:hypothetical protein
MSPSLTGERIHPNANSIFISVKHLSSPEVLRLIECYLQISNHVLIHISRHEREGLL